MVEFALEVRCDPQLVTLPEVLHFTFEVLGEWGEWIDSRVLSLVWAAEDDQLKLPVIIVLLLITAYF